VQAVRALEHDAAAVGANAQLPAGDDGRHAGAQPGRRRRGEGPTRSSPSPDGVAIRVLPASNLEPSKVIGPCGPS